MKKWFTLASVLLASVGSVHAASPVVSHGSAQHGNFGLGMVIGEPTGLSAKLWNAPDRALDFGLAFSFNDYFLIFSDYLFHFAGAFGHSSAFVNELTPYVGIGAMLAFSGDDKYYTDRRFFGRHRNSVGMGLRIPLGIEWQPARAPVGIFVELVPGMAIIPGTSGFLDGGIGARYYF